MKTVLYIYHTSSIGGGSYCLLNILKSIDRTYIRPVVLLKEDGPLVAEIKALDIPTYFLSSLSTVPYNVSTLTPRKIKNACSLISSLSKYETILNEINPDVVYVNTMMLYPYLRPAKKKRIKTIIHIREHWERGEHSWQRNIALSHIQKYADEIIAINRYSASMIENYGRKATIVYDWINMYERFEYMPLEDIFKEDIKRIKTFLYLGGMQKSKGVLEVLTAFNSLTNDNYRLLALGINVDYKPSGIKSLIKTLLKAFNYKSYSERVIDIIQSDPRIKCIKSTYNIRHLYEQAYCVLSYFTIPHANLSLAESIICNTLNIAALTDESLEYSNEGELALLYKENSFEEFMNILNNIENIYNDYNLRLQKNSKLIEQKFSPERNISQLNHIINLI